jgi:hypothetical protein
VGLIEKGCEGWLVGVDLLGVSCDEEKLSFVTPKGSRSERNVLWASVNVDDGTVGVLEGAVRSQSWAVEWLRSELDPELLANLRQRLMAAKQEQEKAKAPAVRLAQGRLVQVEARDGCRLARHPRR